MRTEDEAVARALDDLERELDTRFKLHERIVVQHVLERLVDDVPKRAWFDPS
jgi:hypothetical protein